MAGKLVDLTGYTGKLIEGIGSACGRTTQNAISVLRAHSRAITSHADTQSSKEVLTSPPHISSETHLCFASLSLSLLPSLCDSL